MLEISLPLRLYCTLCPPTRYACFPFVILEVIPRIIVYQVLVRQCMYTTQLRQDCDAHKPKSSVVETMSASSGSKGFCNVCSHANNEHNTYTCDVKGCRKKFKVCQTGSHMEWNAEDGAYVLCKACALHPYSCSNIDAYNIKRLC